MKMHPHPQEVDEPCLVLVTGAGRSGTSAMAGTLHHLGFHVPEPVLPANESNPSGFFESRWPTRFHRRIMKRANIELTDGRPVALKHMRSAVTSETRQELDAWLTQELARSERVLVKDPRAIWVPWLWCEVAQRSQVAISFLTMLRHPAEVIGSRQTYYASYRPGMDEWNFSVMNLCGWINGSLILERQTRDQRRSFVLYNDLLEDWRSVLRRVTAELGVSVDYDLTSAEHHQVDDLINPGLRRHRLGWSDWQVPTALRDIAEETFLALSRLAKSGGHDPQAEAELDVIGERYASLYRDSQAIAQDESSARARRAKAQAGDELRKKLQASPPRDQAKGEQAKGDQAPPPVPLLIRRFGKLLLNTFPALRAPYRRIRRRLTERYKI